VGCEDMPGKVRVGEARVNPSLAQGRPVSFLHTSHHINVHRSLRQFSLLTILVAGGCHSAKPSDDPSAPAEQPVRPLAQLASQRVIVTPTYYLATGDALGWAAQIPKGRDYLRSFDDEVATVLADRGLKSQWTYPADLLRATKANPTYGVDPYTLGANILRGSDVVSGTRLIDPLATQLRTMIALQEGARAVLVPVEIRFEKAGATGMGVAALKVALLDGRLGDVRWIGMVRSDPAPALSRAVLTSLASRFADLFTAP
jgi:hypothetical protein